MLYYSLNLVKDHLNQFFDSMTDRPTLPVSQVVILENIGTVDDDKLRNLNNILITLINISEEFTLKNQPPGQRNNSTVNYRNPSVFLNLYLLFTACMNNYENALIYISHVIRFFQGNNILVPLNPPDIDSKMDGTKIVLDLFSPTFEQANYIWSTLGGKQYPYVLYKLRLVELDLESTIETRGVIKEINLNSKGT